MAQGQGYRVGSDPEHRALFGRVLAEVLVRGSVTQGHLAARMGIAQSTVSGWITGKYEPAPATVFTIERVLDIEPGRLSRCLGYVPSTTSAPVSVEAAIAYNLDLDDDSKVRPGRDLSRPCQASDYARGVAALRVFLERRRVGDCPPAGSGDCDARRREVATARREGAATWWTR